MRGSSPITNQVAKANIRTKMVMFTKVSFKMALKMVRVFTVQSVVM